MTAILLGCDPEVFVKKGEKFLSAFGLIKGDKKSPQKVPRGAVQVDGMALEFNIDPASTEAEFCINVKEVLAHMTRMVPGYQVVTVPVAHFDADYMKTQPQEALELGCDPDFNAYSGMANVKPDGDRPMRTASGHIHVGWTDGQDINDPNHINRAFMVVRNLDFYLGLPSLEYDNDTLRREMYGKAGCCRIKPYGVEYRTLSNRWLSSEALTAWVYRATLAGVNATIQGVDLTAKYGDVQAIINNSDLKAARKIVKAEKLEVCRG